MPNVNGISWNAPAPTVTTYNVTPSVGQEFSEAMRNAPVEKADREAKIAEDQARVQGAQAEGLAANDQIAQRLTQLAQQNPALGQSPMWQKMISQRLGQLGIQAPQGADGSIDVGALSKMFAPPAKPWAQWTPAEIQAQRALPPEERTLPPDAPEMARAEKAVTPMTSAEESKMNQDIERMAQGLGRTVSVPTFTNFIQAQRRRLITRGMDTSSLDQYLSPDGSGPSQLLKENTVAPLVQAQIDHLNKLGVQIDNEDEYRSDQMKEKVREFDKTQVFNRDKLAATERIADKRAEEASARTSIMMGNLQARMQSIQNTQSYRSSAIQINAYSAMINKTSELMRSASDTLKGNIVTINQMKGNPDLRKSPQYQKLIDQSSALQSFLQSNAPVIESEQAKANSGLAGFASSITGYPMQAPPAPPAPNINIVNNIPGVQNNQSTSSNSKGTISRQSVIEIGKQHGLTPDQAIKDAQARGYVVQ